LEKFADENLIHYTDRPFFALTKQAQLPERKLFGITGIRGNCAGHEWRNLWLDCFTEVRRRIHAAYGFKLEVPEPTVSAHLWDADLKKLGPAWVETVTRAALPEYARLGYRQVFHAWCVGFGHVGTTTRKWKAISVVRMRTGSRKNLAVAAGMRQLNAAAPPPRGCQSSSGSRRNFSRHAPIWKETSRLAVARGQRRSVGR